MQVDLTGMCQRNSKACICEDITLTPCEVSVLTATEVVCLEEEICLQSIKAFLK